MELLAKHRIFQTTDHGDGQDFASQVWERHHSKLKGKQFALAWNQAELRHASLAYVDHPCRLVATCEGPVSDTFRVVLLRRGRMDHKINGSEAVSLPGTCVIHPPQAELQLDIESISLVLLNLDGNFVRSALAQRFSELPPVETWAASLSPVSPAVATLNSLCLWMAQEFENPNSSLLTESRVTASFERTLLTLFVEALVEQCPNIDSIRGDLSVVHLSRAEEWIDAHVKEAIGVEDVAAALGVNAQALVKTFTRLRGLSPMRAILHRRLECARDALASAGPGATVTGIATEFGFFELGRFAVRYRERFGEKPSETLARRLGQFSDPSVTMQHMDGHDLKSA
jgi:AraC-like DNA-binding protein